MILTHTYTPTLCEFFSEMRRITLRGRSGPNMIYRVKKYENVAYLIHIHNNLFKIHSTELRELLLLPMEQPAWLFLWSACLALLKSETAELCVSANHYFLRREDQETPSGRRVIFCGSSYLQSPKTLGFPIKWKTAEVNNSYALSWAPF